MNYKQMIAIVVIIVGVVLLIFGFYGKYRMDEARQDIDTTTGFFPDNPVKETVSDRLHGKVDAYALPVTLCFVGGVILIIIGGAGVYFYRSKKQ